MRSISFFWRENWGFEFPGLFTAEYRMLRSQNLFQIMQKAGYSAKNKDRKFKSSCLAGKWKGEAGLLTWPLPSSFLHFPGSFSSFFRLPSPFGVVAVRPSSRPLKKITLFRVDQSGRNRWVGWNCVRRRRDPRRIRTLPGGHDGAGGPEREESWRYGDSSGPDRNLKIVDF